MRGAPRYAHANASSNDKKFIARTRHDSSVPACHRRNRRGLRHPEPDRIQAAGL